MDDAKRKPEGLGEKSVSATWPFINPTWTSPGSNLGFNSEKSVTIKIFNWYITIKRRHEVMNLTVMSQHWHNTFNSAFSSEGLYGQW
jgi:hypothetical protein